MSLPGSDLIRDRLIGNMGVTDSADTNDGRASMTLDTDLAKT
jgi:hypothetical protein